MKISRMPGPFGAIVEDFDLATDRSAATMRALIAALHAHQILAIRGQKLSNADYVAFGCQWGRPLAFHLKDHTRDDHPEMIRIGNAASTPNCYRDGAMHWHAAAPMKRCRPASRCSTASSAREWRRDADRKRGAGL